MILIAISVDTSRGHVVSSLLQNGIYGFETSYGAPGLLDHLWCIPDENSGISIPFLVILESNRHCVSDSSVGEILKQAERICAGRPQPNVKAEYETG